MAGRRRLGDDKVMQAVPSRERPAHQNQPPEPDYPDIRHQLQTNKHVTLQLLWEEYREKNPDGYRYSRYVASVFMLRNHVNPVTDARSGDVDAT